MIEQFRGPFKWLSNFYTEPCGITNEHRYQAAKTDDPVWKARILAAETPQEAKKLGRECPLRPYWELEKLEVMRECLRIKFSSPILRLKLVATRDNLLQEGNHWHDEFWGVNLVTGIGYNWLGVLLMELREEIKHEV